jgi:hypothetical protein
MDHVPSLILENVHHVGIPVAPGPIGAGACTGHRDGDGGAGAGGDAIVVGAGDPGDVVPPWSVAGASGAVQERPTAGYVSA